MPHNDVISNDTNLQDKYRPTYYANSERSLLYLLGIPYDKQRVFIWLFLFSDFLSKN